MIQVNRLEMMIYGPVFEDGILNGVKQLKRCSDVIVEGRAMEERLEVIFCWCYDGRG